MTQTKKQEQKLINCKLEFISELTKPEALEMLLELYEHSNNKKIQ